MDSVTSETLNGIDFNILLVDEVQFFKPKDIEALSDIADKRNIPVVCYGCKYEKPITSRRSDCLKCGNRIWTGTYVDENSLGKCSLCTGTVSADGTECITE